MVNMLTESLLLASAALDGGGRGGGNGGGRGGGEGYGASDGLTSLTDTASGGLAWPWWVAIGLGVAVVVAALGVGALLWWRRRAARKDAAQDDATAESAAHEGPVLDAEIVEPGSTEADAAHEDGTSAARSPFAQADQTEAAPRGARDILAERLAQGEIEPDDYRRRVEALNEV